MQWACHWLSQPEAWSIPLDTWKLGSNEISVRFRIQAGPLECWKPLDLRLSRSLRPIICILLIPPLRTPLPNRSPLQLPAIYILSLCCMCFIGSLNYLLEMELDSILWRQYGYS